MRNEFFLRVLRWNPAWLRERENRGGKLFLVYQLRKEYHVPVWYILKIFLLKLKGQEPDVAGENVQELPLHQSYHSYSEYIQICTVPFMFETWQSVCTSTRLLMTNRRI